MMSDRPGRGNTSLPLIVLALIVGLGLGWLIRGALRQPAGLAAPPTLTPTSASAGLPPATAAPTLPPTSAPPTVVSEAPTAAPEPTVAPEPTAVQPEPTAPPPEPTVAPPEPTAPPPEPTAPPPEPTAPPSSEIAGYAGHIVAQGETLETIAASGGSAPELIASYNLLAGPPPPGRALIVPRLAGRTSTLQSAPILVQRGPDAKPWVALTLDAGADSEPVPRMLQTLREHNVHITFFLTGKWVEDNPDLARQIIADGHEIANHTFNHPDLTRLDEAAIRKELADTEDQIRQTTGASARPFFRPPYGAYDQRVLRIVEGEGYLPIYWTLDSLDSVGEPKTPEFLLERVTAKLTPEQLRGAIILAHCGSAPTADALPRILDRFAEMGFEVKKLSEVLGA